MGWGKRALLLGSLGVAVLGGILPGDAIPPRNLGFESGLLAPGWSGAGRVLDNYPPHVSLAPDGHFFLQVFGACFTHSVHQRITLKKDRVLSGLAAFQSNEFLDNGRFNDFATITVDTPAGDSVVVYAKSVADVGGGFRDFSPFEKWSYTVPADGLYTLTYASTNATDCFFGSDLLGDAVATTTRCDPLLPGLALRCTLTNEATGAPMAGEAIHFTWAGPTPGESIVLTDAQGIATDPSMDDWRAAVTALGYSGEFYGSANGNGSTGAGRVA